MKYISSISKNVFCGVLSLFFALNVSAQSDDPIVLTINGKDVPRSEFEYAFNKNGSVEDAVEKKSVDEYVEMFVNYRLKVEAALDAHMDTLSSFKKEFLTYRDMQLTPYMVDEFFIDSVAHSLYDDAVKRLDGKDLLRPRHIVFSLASDATEEQRQAVFARADSVYNMLKAGGDFARLAHEYSDDKMSAATGGLLPWIGPGSMPQSFEDAAYQLKAGEYSAPVLTKFGYHIIKMDERKQFEPYDKLRDQIIKNLKQQGIEEASAEYRIQKLVGQSHGKLTREEVLDSVRDAHIADDANLRYLIKEYYDGLLFFEVSKQNVFDPASADDKNLDAYFKANKSKYVWAEPRFVGRVLRAKNDKVLKEAKKVVKANLDNADLKSLLKEKFNKDSITVQLSDRLVVEKGKSKLVDALVFKEGKLPESKMCPAAGYVGKKQKKPLSYMDVRAEVLSDYQDLLEQQWVEGLRKKYVVVKHEDALRTVNAH